MQNLILDLDNTIYQVKSIGDKLFTPLFDLLRSDDYNLEEPVIIQAKEQIMRIPFQKVATMFNFPPALIDSAMEILRNLTYDEPMCYFENYSLIRELNTPKFLLTMGFKKLQESKIRSLKINNDFTEIFIVDPDNSGLVKKDIMMHIMSKYHLSAAQLLVVGDDPESEIKAANELGIPSFLLDTNEMYPESAATYKSKTLADVLKYMSA